MRLIDADKLNKKKKYCFQVQGPPFPKNEYFIRLSDVFAAPTIDPSKLMKRGRWLNEPGRIPRCSVCMEYSDDADTGQAIFCPFCGADMRQEGMRQGGAEDL